MSNWFKTERTKFSVWKTAVVPASSVPLPSRAEILSALEYQSNIYLEYSGLSRRSVGNHKAKRTNYRKIRFYFSYGNVHYPFAEKRNNVNVSILIDQSEHALVLWDGNDHLRELTGLPTVLLLLSFYFKPQSLNLPNKECNLISQLGDRSLEVQ